MPTVQSTTSGYRYWTADLDDQEAPRLEFISTGQWQCDRCFGVVSEMPEQTFEARATAHVQGTSHEQEPRTQAATVGSTPGQAQGRQAADPPAVQGLQRHHPRKAGS